VHVPQDEESQTEARLLMAVPIQIVSPQANKPCIGFVQDAVIGSWLLTREASVPRRVAVELWASIQHERKELPVQKTYSGKEIFSLLLPHDLQYQNVKAGVLILDGRLVEGALCKMTLGATSGGIVHSLYLSHGPARVAHFLSDTQRLVNRWLAHRGFSIRLGDCEPSLETAECVAMTIRLAEQKVKRILNAEAVSCLPAEQIEGALSEIANRVLTDVGKVVHASLDVDRNALYQAVLSGSKGNLINIAQLLGCIGQTSVEGHRIFVADAQRQFGEPGSLSSCGFVQRSYFAGLNSTEFFFHTMAGREGLIDTAVKTANTGYLQRRLMKAMETLTISYDRTVRNAKHNILQYLYGADSFDASFLVKQSLPCLLTPLEALQAEFEAGSEWEAFKAALLDVRAQRCRSQGDVDDLVYCPGSIQDVIFTLRGREREGPRTTARLVLKAVGALCEQCCTTPWGRRSAYESLLRWSLRYSAMRDLSASAFFAIVEEMRRRTLCALVAPGEAVGALAAQSISEPLTQLTLNTFHSCGVKAKNVTLGVPRIKELIDVTKNMKTPSLRLVLRQEWAHLAQRLKTSLVHVCLGDVMRNLIFIEEPFFFDSAYSDADAIIARRARAVMEAPAEACPWIGRIELDPPLLLQTELTPADVACLIAKSLPLYAAASQETDEVYLLRLRPVAHGQGSTPHPKGSHEERLALRVAAEALVLRACREIVLHGLKGITGVAASKETLHTLQPNGDYVTETVTVLETQGGSLATALSLGLFRAELCTSNDVHSVHKVLGIEAAAAVLFDQIRQTLTFDGSYTNERHLMLLCSFCTSQSTLLPISRHGINRSADSGVLSRASFEEVSDQLLEAAIYGDAEHTGAFSPAIMVGQRAINVGTGICYTIPNAVPEPQQSLSDDDVVFTVVDADVQMLSYSDEVLRTEVPYNHAGVSLGVPSVLQHSFITDLPKPALAYFPSSPKTLMASKKRAPEPLSPGHESKACAARKGESLERA
jgi:DNA-directed RNA polymerase II subunit RPB1